MGVRCERFNDCGRMLAVSDRDANRARFPEFSAIVDRYRDSITGAWVYDPRTGEVIAGTAPTPQDHAPWPASDLEPVEYVAPEKAAYRGKRR